MSRVFVEDGSCDAVLVVNSKKYGTFRSLIDNEVAARVAERNWSVDNANNRIYFFTNVRNAEGKRTTLYLHRFIMDAPADRLVDHKNPSATLDNRKANLRICTDQQNCTNTRPRVGCSSQYKGIYFHKQHSRWFARISVNGVPKSLGLFTSELEAAKAYDVAALEYYGEFAYLNFAVTAVMAA